MAIGQLMTLFTLNRSSFQIQKILSGEHIKTYVLNEQDIE